MRLWLIFALIINISISSAAELRVASAANFYPTLKKIKNRYEEKSHHKVTIIRASTGKLFAQIIRGAPYDVFLSADSARAEKLVKMGKSLDDISQVYAIGQLGVWMPEAESSQAILEKLTQGKFNKLAIANPKTAPYGKASIEALKALELYEEVKHKLVFGENISQTYQFVESGAADIALVARSYVNDGVYWEVESYLHQPIKQKMLVIKHSKQLKLAKDFTRFIQSPEIRKLIKADGYALMGMRH